MIYRSMDPAAAAAHQQAVRVRQSSAGVPAALLWKNLSVFEPSGGCHIPTELKEEKRILKGINGAILYKSLNAIMGPSGAGKTTLLKCLFGTSSIKYTGSIYVGDRSTKAVFISQNEEDHLLLNLTVEESIRFACKVKNNSSCQLVNLIQTGGKDKAVSADKDLVSSLIEQLDLERCRHTLAGKCSGGQKKRLAIAQELASKVKPKIIFMDEPTSGIDSSVSYLVLKQLQSLSQRNGIAILCTIHQPSYKILELFDQLYILSRRGRVIYEGKPHFLRPHLLRYSAACPDGHNPADVVIELASTETRKDNMIHLKPGCLGFCSSVSIVDHHRDLIHHSNPTSEISKIETLEKVAEIQCEEMVERLLTPQMFEVKKLCSTQTPKTIFHTWFLFKRSFINSVLREPRWLSIRFLLHVLVAAILSFLYNGNVGLANGCLKIMNTQTNSSSSSSSDPLSSSSSPSPEQMCRCPTGDDMLRELRADNLVGKNVAFLFFNLMFLMFASLMPTVLTFPAEMKVFLNEHRNGWYSTRSYYWAKTFVEFMVQLPLPYAYSLYIYWWTGQLGLSFSSDSRFSQFVLITILSSFIAQGVGLMIGAIFTHNFNISIFVSTIFMMFNFLFSGFFIKIDQMGNVEFLTKFSFTRFAFEAIIVAVYGDRCKPPPPILHPMPTPVPIIRSTIGSTDWQPITSTAASVVAPHIQTASNQTIHVISTIMYQFNVKEDIFNESILWLLLHLVGWRILTYITLWWKANPDSFNKKFFFVYFSLRRCSLRKFLCTILSFLLFVTASLACFTFFMW